MNIEIPENVLRAINLHARARRITRDEAVHRLLRSGLSAERRKDLKTYLHSARFPHRLARMRHETFWSSVAYSAGHFIFFCRAVLIGLYVLAFALAMKDKLYPRFDEEAQKVISDPSFWTILLSCMWAVLPPIWFICEYWVVRRRVATKPPTDWFIYMQDWSSKLWAGMLAVLVIIAKGGL